ncbi:hypothetical protein R9C00_21605 [Flammeovirgaceae bacterium SG7u.111]|nr:hypothetical protein [Flammeovirgaceae bacterium SG7u.132]WPO34299.1 hypothetical protein R9C00_21605 [Flammeovirgaceae bacterium SG7u.111]
MKIKPNDSAITSYAREFASVSTTKIFENKHFVSGKELVNATEVKQVNLFLVRIIYEKWQSQTKNLVSPYFDYSSDEVKQALNTLMSLLSKNIKIGKEDLEELIQEATEDCLLLSVSPKAFFEKFLGQFDEKINFKKQVAPVAQYFIVQHKECKTFFKALKSKGNKLSIEDASAVLETIFESNDANFSPSEDVIKTFDQVTPLSLSDIVDGLKEDVEREPSNVLEETSFDLSGVGLEDSGEYEFEDLETTEPSKKGEGLVDELESMLTNKEEESPLIDEMANKPESTPPAEENKDEFSEFDIPASMEPSTPEVKVGEPEESNDFFETDEVKETPDPLLDPSKIEEAAPQVEKATVPNAQKDETPQVEEVKKEEEATPAPAAASTVLEKLGGTTEDEGDEDKGDESQDDSDNSHYQSLLEKLGHTKKNDIRSNMSLNMKFRYQNDLFAGDNAEFNNALDLIEQCSDYQKAMELLKTKYMRTYNWDVSDDTTKEFLTMVTNQF